MARESDIKIKIGQATLGGTLSLPDSPSGLIVFAHGSGSSRFSPRNRQVAETLNDAGFATLLFDLLTERESTDRALVFDIPFLAGRLERVTEWVFEQEELRELPVGYFGASTGAAAALLAAAAQGDRIGAVVSRGGRPDLASHRLEDVSAPTLLIVGGNDDVVIELNRSVLPLLPLGALVVIPGATHLFEEPGTLEAVADEAVEWFLEHLVRNRSRARRTA